MFNKILKFWMPFRSLGRILSEKSNFWQPKGVPVMPVSIQDLPVPRMQNAYLFYVWTLNQISSRHFYWSIFFVSLLDISLEAIWFDQQFL
jgi:hypothetical protein